jgi:peptide/nickel transport system substrate-binding protein
MRHALLLVTVVLSLVAVAPDALAEVKTGGVLRLANREDLVSGFALHESVTVSDTWVAMPCYSNLVVFDQTKRVERLETIAPELAERWSWQDNYRRLVFFLRKDVRWHDGEPFTSKDVKFTFDIVRGAPEASARLRSNPRKEWYANVESIETPDRYVAVFELKRPQPSLLAMLASGFSPVLPAHVPPAEHRSRCIGTGPFKFKEWRRGQFIDLVRNAEYFRKGRPHLDGLRYVVITERGTRTAALQGREVDVAFPGDTTVAIAEQLRAAVPTMVFTETTTNVNENLLINTKRPPFDNVKVRQALSLAIDRGAYTKAVSQGSALVGAAMLPKPWGIWGLPDKEVIRLPGYGTGTEDKRRAENLLSDAGFSRARPLKVEVVTRSLANYMDLASFVVAELKRVGMDATLKQIESSQFYGIMTRRDYQIAANLTGIGVDDPDVNLYENYACGSARNYTDYCDDEVMKLIDEQSRQVDSKKRLGIVWQIQRKLETDAARPILGWRTDRFARWAHVKDLFTHQVTYNCCRHEETWLDR